MTAAADQKLSRGALVALVVGSMKRVFTHAETALLVVLCVAAIAALLALITGAMTV